MRLLTLNTLFKGDVRLRLRALAAVLEASDYDVVGLQELMFRRNYQLLCDATPSFPFHAASGGPLLRGGLAVLARHGLVDEGFVSYPMGGPIRRGMVMRKGFQVVRVGGFAVINTHLSANLDDDWSDTNRYTRLARVEFGRLTEAVNAIDPAVPVVVTGDFNVPRTSSVLARFLADTGARDAMAGDPEPTYRPTPRWPGPPAFDHVLVRPGAGADVAVDARIVLRDQVALADGRLAYLSDHFGVEATLTVTPHVASAS